VPDGGVWGLWGG
jgi:hypothetical protein